MDWDSAVDEEGLTSSLDLKNGLLSFENPNYHLDPARFDDAFNSNTPLVSVLYEELYSDIDRTNHFARKPSVQNRRKYASLDIGSMGVDIDAGSVPEKDQENNSTTGTHSVTISSNYGANDNELAHKRPPFASNPNYRDTIDPIHPTEEGPVIGTRTCMSETSCEKPMEVSMSPSMTDDEGSLFSMERQLQDDLHALPNKYRSSDLCGEVKDDFTDEKRDQSLPAGWEKHEDSDGPYYWHIKSGTIQRDPPTVDDQSLLEKSTLKESLTAAESPIAMPNYSVSRSVTTSGLSDIELRSKNADMLLKRRSYPACKVDPDSKENTDVSRGPIRFPVRSLGWVEIAEDDLTPERSSKAVNKCIVDLSLGKNDILDGVGRWGDGKDLFMDLDATSLKLLDPENLTVLNTQPIHTIRVWGVGRDNGRDFAYVARDKVTRKHMCHVFRCDSPARTIANTLRDICNKIMIERDKQLTLGRSFDGLTGSTLGSSSIALGKTAVIRPTHLPMDHRRLTARVTSPSYQGQSFPTPMEEPKKMLKAQYLGSRQVSRAGGMDVLNEAIDSMSQGINIEDALAVNVAVAPSTITVTSQSAGPDDPPLAECRVRFLSFLGIGHDVKTCAFIMHTAQDQFIAHGFYCEPSSGALCKTVEAACKLRYQKCLDAHGPQRDGSLTPGKGLGATIKSMIGSLTGRKAKSTES